MEWICLSSNIKIPLILHSQPSLLFLHICYLSSGWHQRQDLANICNILKSMKKAGKGLLFNVPSNMRTEEQEVQKVGGMAKTRIIVLFS